MKTILLGITGSIAAYKSAYLARLIVTDGFRLRVAMTPAARKFVGPLTFEAITGGPVYDDPLEIPSEETRGSDTADGSASGIVHTDLTENAAALVIAPATANSIAKLAAGFGDDAVAVLALALPPAAPLIVAPAMNPRMWASRAVQANIAALVERGAVIVTPDFGDTACRDIGTGRMSEPEEILAAAKRAIARRQSGFATRKVLILTGPTREAFDDVRFISNGSSGKMGVALATAAYQAGHEVTVVSGPACVMPQRWIKTITVESADEMLAEAKKVDYDFLFAPAAIADYKPVNKAAGKPEKKENLTLELLRNADLLYELTKSKPRGSIITAFAAEESLEATEKARSKGKAKNADFIVLNEALEAMNADVSSVVLIGVADNREVRLDLRSKQAIARKLIETIIA